MDILQKIHLQEVQNKKNMAHWIIDKQFDFDYGHRVWTQEPDSELSCGHKSICRHLHGHRGRVHVFIKGEELNDQGMVTDFVNLNWFKKFLDDALDHKMILDINDPGLLVFFPLLEGNLEPYILDVDFEEIDERNYKAHPHVTFSTMNAKALSGYDGHIREIYEGLVLVDFVPTSENLAKWLLEVVQKKMDKLDVNVYKLEFFETPKSRSTYYGDE